MVTNNLVLYFLIKNILKWNFNRKTSNYIFRGILHTLVSRWILIQFCEKISVFCASTMFMAFHMEIFTHVKKVVYKFLLFFPNFWLCIVYFICDETNPSLFWCVCNLYNVTRKGLRARVCDTLLPYMALFVREILFI